MAIDVKPDIESIVAEQAADPAAQLGEYLDDTFDPLSLTDTYASRPAATSVADGAVFYASDIPETYRSNGSSWAVVGSGGNELGYATSEVSAAPTGTAADITGLTTTFVVGERPIRIDFQGQGKVRDSGNILWCEVLLDGAAVTRATAQSALPYEAMSCWARVTGLTPGSTHTAKIRGVMAIANGTGIGDLLAGAAIKVMTV